MTTQDMLNLLTDKNVGMAKTETDEETFGAMLMLTALFNHVSKIEKEEAQINNKQ